MNIVDNVRMNEFLGLSRRADPSSIKSLDQSERRILMSMLTALRRGDESVAIRERDAALTLDSIREKLARPQSLHPSFIFMKIFKAVLNFFGWRVSSQAVTRAVNETAEVRARAEERAREREAAITDFQQRLAPRIAERARDISLENQRLLVEEVRETIASQPNLQLPSRQFTGDYSRVGTRLRINDASKGGFQGRFDFLEGETSRGYLEFHEQGFSRIFSEEELLWKRTVQAAVTQSPLNMLCVPLLNTTLEEMAEWRPVHFDAEGSELRMWTEASLGLRNIDVDVVRNPSSGKIERVLIRVQKTTPVAFRPGGRTSIPSDTIGYYDSEIGFQLSIDEKEGLRFSDLRCNHVFIRGPLPEARDLQSV